MAAAVAQAAVNSAVAAANVVSEAPGKVLSAATTKGRRLLVILHGEKTDDVLVRDAIKRLRSDGYTVEVRVTYEAGDVDRLVKEAVALRSADTLVAAGGDGTVCEVVEALLQHTGGLPDTKGVVGSHDSGPESKVLAQGTGRPPHVPHLSVGILPMGTSNDFAATTGIPNDPYEALLLATRPDSAKALDVGLLNGKMFMNTATIGASAEVGKLTSSRIKKLLGPAAFLITGVRSVTSWCPVSSVMRFPAVGAESARASLEQATSLVSEVAAEPAGSTATGKAEPKKEVAQVKTERGVTELVGVPLLHATAANNRQIASMVSVSPNALLDDGHLDIVYLNGTAGQQASRLLMDLMRKGTRGTKIGSNLLRVPWLEVLAEKPMEWSVDGEPMPTPSDKFSFSMLHRAVNIHLPDNRMLVAGQEAGTSGSVTTDAKAGKHRKGSSNPFKIARGRLRAPSLAEMTGKVVRFRKKVHWPGVIRATAQNALRNVLVASLGGLLVHLIHNATRDSEKRSVHVTSDRKPNAARRAVNKVGSRLAGVGRALSFKRA
ncbi:ATP-NAD kinase-like domain-containing protein [Haematococcus lacustris]